MGRQVVRGQGIYMKKERSGFDEAVASENTVSRVIWYSRGLSDTTTTAFASRTSNTVPIL